MRSNMLIPKIYKYNVVYVIYMFFRKCKDPKLKNVSGISEKVKEKYRSDSHLETILKRENVTSLYLLKKKYRDERKRKSIQ